MTQNFEPAATILSNDNDSGYILQAEAGTATGAGFEQFGFVPNLSDAIVKAGYTKATPIQERAIPILLSGRDVLGIAQTGTGKTAAFALPMLQKIMQGKFRGIQGLILVPTRELAVQVCAAITQLAGRSSVRATTIFGGQSFGMQVKALRANPDIIVACPGRLLDHVERRTIRLDSVSTLVLDEADQMFDMGFLPTVRQIMRDLPKQRQSMLFSATMPSEIKSLAMEVLTNPETVQVANEETAATITHKLYGVTQAQKSDMLVKLLKQSPSDSVLVFARTKQRTQRLQEALFKGGLTATSLQGNLSQQQREKSMKGFRAGKFKVMVATDIASRGIDVASIGLVINYDMPLTTETYTHRVGRTGRALRSGTAVTLACPEDRSMVRLLERRLKVGFEHGVIEGFDRVDLAGGNADSVTSPQYGKRAGGGRFSSRGGQGGSGRGGDSRGGSRGSFRSERPRGDRPMGDRPAGDRPYGDRPAGDRPSGDRVVRERSFSDRPQTDRPQGDRPYGSRPQGDRPYGNRPQGDRFGNAGRSSDRGGFRGGQRDGQRAEGSDRYSAPSERSEFAPRGPRANSDRPAYRGARSDAPDGAAGRGESSGSRFGGNGGARSDRPYGSRTGGGNRGPRSGGGNRFGGRSDSRSESRDPR